MQMYRGMDGKLCRIDIEEPLRIVTFETRFAVMGVCTSQSQQQLETGSDVGYGCSRR